MGNYSSENMYTIIVAKKRKYTHILFTMETNTIDGISDIFRTYYDSVFCDLYAKL